MKVEIKWSLKIANLLLTGCLAMACNPQPQQQPRIPELSNIQIGNVPWIPVKSMLEVSLWTTDGQQVMTDSQLKPNTQYQLKVKSDNPISLKVKVADGFSIEGMEPVVDILANSRIIKIKTQPQVGQVYINMVPVFYKDKELLRERPQSFLLPNTTKSENP